MRYDGRSTTTIILVGVALILAALAGVLIPLSSGSAPGQKVSPWTPPAPSATATTMPSQTRAAAPTPSRTRPPTATAGALPSATARSTASMAPAASLTPTASPTVTRGPTTATPITPAATATGIVGPSTATPSPVTQEPPANPSPPPAEGPIVTVRQGPLSLRTQPSRSAPLVAQAEPGATYSAIGRTADSTWLKVCCVNKASVWLAAEFVDVAGSVSDLPTIQP